MPVLTLDAFKQLEAAYLAELMCDVVEDGPQTPVLIGLDRQVEATLLRVTHPDEHEFVREEDELARAGAFLIYGDFAANASRVRQILRDRDCVAALLVASAYATPANLAAYMRAEQIDLDYASLAPNAVLSAAVWPEQSYTQVFTCPASGQLAWQPTLRSTLPSKLAWLDRVLPGNPGQRNADGQHGLGRQAGQDLSAVPGTLHPMTAPASSRHGGAVELARVFCGPAVPGTGRGEAAR